MGQPPLRRADPAGRRRDAPSRRDRRRPTAAGAPADHAPARPDRADPRDRDRPGDGRADPRGRWDWSRSARTNASLTFRPPSWRSDLEREIDLIEEVARIHGYEHIPEDRAVPLTSAPRGHRERVESAVRDFLTGAGFDEAVTFSLVEERLSAPLQPGPAVAPLRVDHSSRRRESALRQSLVPSLLSARLHNESHGQFDAELFEIANVYLPQARPRSPGRADAAGDRRRPRFPGPQGGRRGPPGRGCMSPLRSEHARSRSPCSRRDGPPSCCWETPTWVTSARSTAPSSRNSSCGKRVRRRSWSSMSY